MSLQITSIQRFCVNDGPGIRTTVFMKGCCLHCPWCANPECCGDPSEIGLSNTAKIEDVLEICLRDKAFYGYEGGITASGGEPLLQAKELERLFFMLQEQKVGCCIETSLYAPEEAVEAIVKYLDYIYIDMKILDKTQFNRVLGGSLDLYKRNLDKVFNTYNKERICIRVPLVEGLTYTDENIKLIGDHIQYYKPYRCEIFSVHNLAKAKYSNMGIEYNSFRTVDNSEMEEVKRFLETKSDSTLIQILNI